MCWPRLLNNRRFKFLMCVFENFRKLIKIKQYNLTNPSLSYLRRITKGYLRTHLTNRLLSKPSWAMIV